MTSGTDISEICEIRDWLILSSEQNAACLEAVRCIALPTQTCELSTDQIELRKSVSMSALQMPEAVP